MTVFKYNEGKLVEQPTMEKPKCFTGNSSDRDCPDCKAYHDHIASLRTYIAEGFAEDELVEEKDLEIVYQIGSKCGWYSIPYEIFKPYPNELRKRIIARRKVTKEEGEKPDELKAILNEIVAGMVREMGVEWCAKMINRINNLT